VTKVSYLHVQSWSFVRFGDNLRAVRGDRLGGPSDDHARLGAGDRPGYGRQLFGGRRAPGGEAATTLWWSLTPAELDHQLSVIKNKVLASSAVVCRAPTEDEQPVRELGQRLFKALIADDVWALCVASRQRARENGGVLRLVLRIRPPELARLPWEFLVDPHQQDYLGLTMSLVRYLQVLSPRHPLRVAAPLRILGMVARPSDQHALDTEQEQQRLQDALAGLQRAWLRPAAGVFRRSGQEYALVHVADGCYRRSKRV
jgi:hypothetical protein